MNRKILGLVIALLLCVSVAATVAAIFTVTKPIPATFQVVGVQDFKLYTNSACTTEYNPVADPFDYGAIVRTTTSAASPRILYFKNIGDSPLEIDWSVLNLPTHVTVYANAQRTGVSGADMTSWTQAEPFQLDPSVAGRFEFPLGLALDAGDNGLTKAWTIQIVATELT